MKLIVAGVRNALVTEDDVAEALIEHALHPTEIVSGGSGTVDAAGESLARKAGTPLKIFIAEWSIHGLAAGPIRNREMALYADTLLAFWDGKSKGTKNMIETMRSMGKRVVVEGV